jgi:hypothetical protein
MNLSYTQNGEIIITLGNFMTIDPSTAEIWGKTTQFIPFEVEKR